VAASAPESILPIRKPQRRGQALLHTAITEQTFNTFRPAAGPGASAGTEQEATVSDAPDYPVSCVVADGIADVRLNRPAKLNALHPAMFTALIEVGTRLRDDHGVRAVVLSGNGRAFCAGLDFASFEAMTAGGDVSPRPEPAQRVPAVGQQAAYVWAELPVPVIAAVHGVAFGGGLQLTLGADLRLVAADAQLSVMEIRWGLVPDMTGTQLLPELVGRDIAKELTFTGRILDGAEAARIGLATRTEANPHDAAIKLAAEIAGKNPHAIRRAKHLLNVAGRVDLMDGFAAEQRAIHELIGSPNQAEAVRAAMAKRAPTFADTTPEDH
jgi:enoyl-CoA hydratase/carnithine racemase